MKPTAVFRIDGIVVSLFVYTVPAICTLCIHWLYIIHLLIYMTLTSNTLIQNSYEMFRCVDNSLVVYCDGDGDV